MREILADGEGACPAWTVRCYFASGLTGARGLANPGGVNGAPKVIAGDVTVMPV